MLRDTGAGSPDGCLCFIPNLSPAAHVQWWGGLEMNTASHNAFPSTPLQCTLFSQSSHVRAIANLVIFLTPILILLLSNLSLHLQFNSYITCTTAEEHKPFIVSYYS